MQSEKGQSQAKREAVIKHSSCKSEHRGLAATDDIINLLKEPNLEWKEGIIYHPHIIHQLHITLNDGLLILVNFLRHLPRRAQLNDSTWFAARFSFLISFASYFKLRCKEVK